jgi:hypothetical protein
MKQGKTKLVTLYANSPHLELEQVDEGKGISVLALIVEAMRRTQQRWYD